MNQLQEKTRDKIREIKAQKGVYQCNVRIDRLTHERLKHMKAFYRKLINANVTNGVLIRRALELLSDHLDNLIMKYRASGQQGYRTGPDPNSESALKAEEKAAQRCAAGQYSKQREIPEENVDFPVFGELRIKRVQEPEELRSLNG